MAGLIQSLISPWTSSSSFDPSTYGGAMNLGAQLLANSGPSLMPMTTAQRLGNSLLGAQSTALKTGAARQSLANNAINMQMEMAMMPLRMQWLQNMMGGGSPQTSPQPAAQPGAAAQGAQPVPVPVGLPMGQGGGAPVGAQSGAQGAPQVTPQGSAPVSGSVAGQSGPDPLAQLNSLSVGAMLGIPGVNTASANARAALAFNPALATRMALSKNPITQDRAMLAQAQAAGNGPLATLYYNKLMQDSGALQVSRNGVRQWLNPMTGQWGMVDPANGIGMNGPNSFAIPGYAGAQASIYGARAGSARAAQLAAENGQGIGVPNGGATVPVGAGVSTANAPTIASTNTVPTGVEALQSPGYIPAVLEAPGRVQSAPGNTSPIELRTFNTDAPEQALAGLEEIRKQAAQSQQAVTQVQQVQDAAAQFGPGKFANWRGEMLNMMNSLGMITPAQQAKLGSYQEGTKVAIQLQASVTAALGSREAAQVFSTMGKTVPNLTLGVDGLNKIGGFVKGMARFKMWEAEYGQRLYAQKNVAGLSAVDQTFQTYSNPSYFIMGSMTPSVRQEIYSSWGKAKATSFVKGWQKAAGLGLAPNPNDYEGQ